MSSFNNKFKAWRRVSEVNRIKNPERVARGYWNWFTAAIFFVVDELPPTGEHSRVYSGIWIFTPKGFVMTDL
jgi:hypothetical protein